MKSYSRSHLSDPELLRVAGIRNREIHAQTADQLADIAEIDARQLYLQSAHRSMAEFCVVEWNLSEDAAERRIHAARTARRFPAIFEALADGRLHLTAVNLLAPHLRRENADELLRAATRKSKAQIVKLLAERFPRSEVLALVETFSASSSLARASGAADDVKTLPCQPALARVAPRSKVEPIATQRFALRLIMGQEMHDDLVYTQELLSHQIPSCDEAKVIHKALKLLIREQEKRKFAATDKPRKSRPQKTSNGRHVPAEVRRAVTQRDGRQCTFVSESGRRCTARKFLEFDHIQEFARGGRSTVENVRLRCRAHNQFTAEHTYGAEFMSRKREDARLAAAERRRAAVEEQTKDVIKGLVNLGFPARDARRAAEFSETIPAASLEERMRGALSYFRPRGTYIGRAAPA